MKIGMILDKDYPPDPRVRSEALSLVSAGHEVSILCPEFGTRKLDEIQEGLQIKRFRINHNIYKKCHALSYSFPFYRWIVRSPLDNYLDSYEFDAVHIHDMIIAGIAIDLAQKRGIEVVLDLHENRPAIMSLYSHVYSGIGKYLIRIKDWEYWQCRLANQADKVIVVTSEAKRELCEKCNCNTSKVSFVPNTINLHTFGNYKLENDIIKKYEDKDVLLYLGNTGLRRGTDTAIRAMSYLKNKLDNIILVLVGSSRDDGVLRSLAQEMGVMDLVEFCGWQDESLFPSYLSVANVCLSPLKKNLHHDTTYANKLFQYMFAGKPVIVSDCLAQANVVKETNCGLIHQPGDEKGLALLIKRMIENPEEAQLMGLRGKQAVEEKYNWQNTSSQLLEIYK